MQRAAYSAADAIFAGIERMGVDLRGWRTPFVGTNLGDARFRELDSPHAVSVRGPTAWADGETDHYSRIWQRVARGYLVQSSGILELHGARFHLPSGIISADGRFPAETISLIDFPFRQHYLDAMATLWAPARPLPDGYVLTLLQSANYYHFVCEVLPLAFVLMRDDQWGELPVYVGADLPRFVAEYLRLLGLDGYCRALPAGVYTTRRLRVATFPGLSSSPSPEHLLRLRQACLEAIGPTNEPRRRLYISRADAPDRRIINEGELLSVLAEFGFERATLSDKTLLEQIRMFQTADLIVAPHGAGNTNLLFAPSDCALIELMGPTIHSWSFMTIASTLGQLYGYVACKERGRDLVVDPNAMRAVLSRILDTRGRARGDG